MNYGDHFTHHLRLTLLRVLESAPGGRANASLLRDAAEGMGITVTRDLVKTELAWLAEQRLVKTEEPGVVGLVIATITERGCDVATGRTVTPGVAKPSPR